MWASAQRLQLPFWNASPAPIAVDQAREVCGAEITRSYCCPDWPLLMFDTDRPSEQIMTSVGLEPVHSADAQAPINRDRCTGDGVHNRAGRYYRKPCMNDNARSTSSHGCRPAHNRRSMHSSDRAEHNTGHSSGKAAHNIGKASHNTAKASRNSGRVSRNSRKASRNSGKASRNRAVTMRCR